MVPKNTAPEKVFLKYAPTGSGCFVSLFNPLEPIWKFYLHCTPDSTTYETESYINGNLQAWSMIFLLKLVAHLWSFRTSALLQNFAKFLFRSVPLWSRIQWSLMYSTSKSIKYNQAQSIKLKVSVQLSTWGEFYAAQLQNFLYKVKMSQIASSHPKAADHPNAAFVLFRLRYLDFLFWYFFFGILMKKNLFMFAYLGSFSVLI